MKRFISILILVALIIVPFSVNAQDIDIYSKTFYLDGKEIEMRFYGDEKIIVYEDHGKIITKVEKDDLGYVYVNGKNITSIESINKDDINVDPAVPFSSGWIYAGEFKMTYDIAGLTVGAVAAVLGIKAGHQIIDAMIDAAKAAGL